MQNPLTARRAVKLTAMKIETAQTDLNNSLQVLMSQHGSGTAGAYTPEALAQHRADLRDKAFEPMQTDFDATVQAAQVTLDNAGSFTRTGILSRATPVVEPATTDAIPSDQSATVAELRALRGAIDHSRLAGEIHHAKDDQLLELAGRAAQTGDLAGLNLAWAEARNRGGLTLVKLDKLVDDLPLPEVEEADKHLAELETELKDVRSDFAFLKTGKPDTRHQMNAAMAKQREAG